MENLRRKICFSIKAILPLHSLRKKEDAQMAELVDALDSKSGFRKGVQVRFLFWAP